MDSKLIKNRRQIGGRLSAQFVWHGACVHHANLLKCEILQIHAQRGSTTGGHRSWTMVDLQTNKLTLYFHTILWPDRMQTKTKAENARKELFLWLTISYAYENVFHFCSSFASGARHGLKRFSW